MKKRRKIPNKAELLQLQKTYKTDEKIGERLGGVEAYLVAYWRRKKNIPKYSLPKFSETDIRNLWERYGDDEKAGLELGISKAAFYNWRRRYGFKDKPAFLKLEQLEFNFPGMILPSHQSSLYGQRSAAQKILADLAETERVEVGQEVLIEPDLVVVSGAGAVIEAFRKEADLVWNPAKIMLLLDHAIGEPGSHPATTHKVVREFARRQGIKGFYDLCEGICWQLPVERGLVLPGQLILGSNPHAVALGSMAAFALAVSPEAMAEVWSSGRHTLVVPQSVRIVVTGHRHRAVAAVDIALHLASQLGSNGIAGRAIEYAGSAISQMTIGERFALADMATGTGAIAAQCTYDAPTRRYLTGRTMSRFRPVMPDKDAEYQESYQVNIDQVGPRLARQGRADQVKPVAELDNLPVQQVLLGSCTAGRFEDLRAAADILKGKKVHEGCRLLIIPGSRATYLEALKKGLIRVFIEAGAIVVHPGSPLAMADAAALLAEGERCLTTNYTAVASDDSDASEVYVCSPATAAASALNGAITDPTRYGR